MSIITDNIKKSKLDLEAAYKLLNDVTDELKERLDEYSCGNFIQQMRAEPLRERYSSLIKCKENLEFVIDIFNQYIQNNQQDTSASYSYKPRILKSHYDLGKYQTEAINAQKNVKSLLNIASMMRDVEKKRLYQDCIDRLNYVYSHISRK